ncbi:MAG: bifunctional metallophosphatase/5'-nucleotidase [Chloroflexota bacterium]
MLRAFSRTVPMAVSLCLLAFGVAVGSGLRAADAPVTIRILQLSDWHGQLDPLATGDAELGGAAVYSTIFAAERAADPETLLLTGGDQTGGTPPLSALFADAPAIAALNLMGLDATTLGNHDFDAGWERLRDRIAEAGFAVVAANLEGRAGVLDAVRDFALRDLGTVTVGIVGVIDPEAPGLVFPGSFGPLTISDPAAAMTEAAAAARAAGADVVVGIAHMGVETFDASGAPAGPIVDLARAIDGVDLLLGDHTDVEWSGTIDGLPVVESYSRGRSWSRSTITWDPATGRVTDVTIEHLTADARTTPSDPAVVAMLAPYRAQLADALGVVEGTAAAEILRADPCGGDTGRLCASALGALVADALRAAYGTQIALMNAGGIRADLTCPLADLPTDTCPPVEPGGPIPITFGQVVGVLPFGNLAVTLTVRGSELRTILENAVSQAPAPDGRFPQVSGICLTYDIAAEPGDRIVSVVADDDAGTCAGPELDLSDAVTYTLATNEYVTAGGDGYPVLADRDVTREPLEDVVAAWISGQGTIAPSTEPRVRCTSSGDAACPAPLAP